MTLKPREMVVAGVMSGTSADGVDVAVARIRPQRGAMPGIDVIGHRGFRYSMGVRDAVLRAAAGEMKVDELSRLNWRLGEVYAGCVQKTCGELRVEIGLVGMHGQTIHHQALAQCYAGAMIRATWQIGEAAVVRERLGVPVVSDFRPADLAAGGEGAPLVPMLDYCMFRSETVNRLLLNLGGIANVTVIPAGAGLETVRAFDTGPANMVSDGLMQLAFGNRFDRGGKVASRGRVLSEVLAEIMQEVYFAAQPPKSCGREQFGGAFAERFLRLCRDAGGSPTDAVTTATELTAQSIGDAYARFCSGDLRDGRTELIVAGGGTRNQSMMRALRRRFEPPKFALLTSDELGVKAESKEAVAFALLAWLTWHQLPGNVASATGARGPRVLGKISW